uniref:MTMR6-9 GRAM domain-containing protein n=1 Tax=Haplochromis burtoni TaxID=8153 RepID=A0A3Q2V279_HAPBU
MEHIRTPKVENVRLLDRSSGQRKASVGTLYLSATHAIFVENNPETRKETWVTCNSLNNNRTRLQPRPHCYLWSSQISMRHCWCYFQAHCALSVLLATQQHSIFSIYCCLHLARLA